MKTIEKKLQAVLNRKAKAFKEMAFFLNLEGMECEMLGSHEPILYVGYNDEIYFKIFLEGRNYVLHTDFYREDLVDENGDYIGFVQLDKVKRVQAKTIVSNIVRIANDIENLVTAKLNEQEIWKRQREESHAVYKERIRQEVLAELEAEKATKPKRTRKKASPKMTTVPEAPPMSDVSTLPFNMDDMPEF